MVGFVFNVLKSKCLKKGKLVLIAIVFELQILQRLMITYNGRVGMCCHDWGAQHGVGFVNKDAFEKSKKEYLDVKEKIDKKKKGFELLNQAKMPSDYNEPDHKVESLKEIYNLLDPRNFHCFLILYLNF